MTYKDFIKLKYPDDWEKRVNDDCPEHHGFSNANFGDDCIPFTKNCDGCWDREVEDCDFNKAIDRLGATALNRLLRGGEDALKSHELEYAEQRFCQLLGLAESVPETDEKCSEPHILDSGDRTEFETGAVRDMREGKGRCDLLPLDIIADHTAINILSRISEFQESGDYGYLWIIFDNFGAFRDPYTQLLEVAKHFEEGAKKYGDNNWKKGIPTNVYIDSAVRHYLKFLRGDKDEPHDRAFCWNILCCIWTCIHKPELNTYAKKEETCNG